MKNMDSVVFKGSYPSNPIPKQASLENPPLPPGLRLVKGETVSGVRLALPPASANSELVGERLESGKPVSGFWQLGNLAVVVVFKAKGFNGGELLLSSLTTENEKSRRRWGLQRFSCNAVLS